MAIMDEAARTAWKAHLATFERIAPSSGYAIAAEFSLLERAISILESKIAALEDRVRSLEEGCNGLGIGNNR
jgi:hypothetical protein